MKVRGPYMIALLLFVCAAGVTLYFNRSMCRGMPMRGNWTMSMMWMPMGSELAAASLFTVMWLAMMVAMMLPSTMPMLVLYRRATAFRGQTHPGQAMFAVGAGYFFIWTLFGVAAYLIGVIIARCVMHSDSFSRTLIEPNSRVDSVLAAPHPPLETRPSVSASSGKSCDPSFWSSERERLKRV